MSKSLSLRYGCQRRNSCISKTSWGRWSPISKCL